MSTAPDSAALLRPTVATIDLAAFRRNLRAIRAMLPPQSNLIAVLKADAYGHGAVPLARVCGEEDVEMIAVALLEEAIELQSADIDLPLLVLGPLRGEQIDEAIRRRIAIGVVGPDELEELTERAQSSERTARIHLKLDSGMGRMGLVDADLPRAAELLRSATNVAVDGIYTHFANAGDPDDPFTQKQLAKFSEMLAALRERGVDAPLHHTSNSAATVRRLVSPGDYARVGIALYGGEPLDRGSARLEPVMRWTTRVARLKTIGSGAAVGYGTTFIAQRETRVATLPVGYADGYNRRLSNMAAVLIRGQRAPVIGRVSMDLITVDVTGIPDVQLGDEVVLLGRQGADEISGEELAQIIGTISYEVFCAVNARVPRLYVEGDVQELRSKFLAAREVISKS